mgnify:CR=1 FL=1
MMAERRNGGKPRREENNKTSGSVNKRKGQSHSRKYDVTGGEKQIKTGSKGKAVQGKRDRCIHHNISPTRTANALYPICAVAVSMWICHMSSSLPRNRSI